MSLREAAQAALVWMERADWMTFGAFFKDGQKIQEALRDALAEAESAGAEPVDEEVIGEYGWQGTSRQWWAGGVWLDPDDVVIVRRAAARRKG